MMKTLLIFIIFFSANCIETSEPSGVQPCLEFSTDKFDEQQPGLFQKISDAAFYISAGTALGSASLFARLGWVICSIFAPNSSVTRECDLLSHLSSAAAQHMFSQIFRESPPAVKGVPSSQSSWYFNKRLLSQIPAFSDEEKQLIQFLGNRWLAKLTGFYPFIVNRIYPCFGVYVQVHPETSNTYARNPSIEFPTTYSNRVEAWKRLLPHPKHFPLILTRPFDFREYLPSYIAVSHCKNIQEAIERAALKMQTQDAIVVIDLSHILPQDASREEWLRIWKGYQMELSEACKEHIVNIHRILCIQRVGQKDIGGICILPLAEHTGKMIDAQYQFLLEWISTFGLSANRIELDRLDLKADAQLFKSNTPHFSFTFQSREELIALMDSFDQSWKSHHPQKTLMFKGVMHILKGLLAELSEDKWNKIMDSPTRSLIAQLSFFKIKDQLQRLIREENHNSFFDIVSQIEQIYADVSPLLELFLPFTPEDFPNIYQSLLTSFPVNLKSWISSTVHSSGMMSIAGIFKAVEKSIGKRPTVLYGENTYFECIKLAELVADAIPIEEATEENWKIVDLIIAQFNPSLKRVELRPTEYKLENIAGFLHRALNARQGRPLTLAIDCTIDFIDSHRVSQLLETFQREIETGILNVICYRSGHKYDLFGMDNYCGAPFYMIHNQDGKWNIFDALLNDPVLQTDRLSLNWFCLAYKNAASQLENYRKQIFDNTRALLNKVPSGLFDKNCDYRIIPIEQEADPAFVDIKISGPLHRIRGSALAGGSLFIKCMERGHPIFYRPSLGFYHANFTMIFSKKKSTIRLTVGLDPAQIDLLAEIFELIHTLNDPQRYHDQVRNVGQGQKRKLLR